MKLQTLGFHLSRLAFQMIQYIQDNVYFTLNLSFIKNLFLSTLGTRFAVTHTS